MTELPPLSVLIVDDEPIARRRLTRLLRQIGGVQPVGEAGDVEDAVVAARTLAPDILLLDIQIPGGGGFAVLDRLGAEAPVAIFVTAHDRFALRAFEVAAVDYVTKPVEPARLAAALARARTACAVRDSRERLAELHSTVQTLRGALAEAAGPLRTLWIRAGNEMRNIEIGAITHIRAERDYVRLHAGGRSYLHSDTLASMEEKLTEHGFVRVHRSVLVQRAAVSGLVREGRGRMVLRLSDGAEVPVGRSHLASVGAALGLS